MVISLQEKEVLLKRLEKARQAKIAKKQALLEEKAKVESLPKPEPEPEPKPVTEPVPVSVPIPVVAEALAPPNLIVKEDDEIKLPPKIKKSKKVVETSDDESMEKKPVKKVKQTPYLKLKIYKEPSNPVAFQNLMEALNEPAEEPKPTPQPVVEQKASNEPQPRLVATGKARKEQTVRDLNYNRALALSFFQ